MSRTIQKENEIDTNKPTKHYDEVAIKVRKLLSASGQTFIPELAEGLRQDWCPELSDEKIRNNLRLQKVIRKKILSEWSREGGYSNDNIWSETHIVWSFPDWLRNPIQQESTATPLEKARQKKQEKIRERSLISNSEKNKLTTFATSLPKTVIIPEEKEEEKLTQLEEGDEQELYGYGLGKFGDTDKNPRELLGDVTDSAANLFEALMVGKKKIPHSVDADMIVDYIKPTREEWKSLMLEADKTQRARVHNWLSFLADVIEDRLEILSQVK